MQVFVLKDKEKQEALEKLIPGFSKILDEAVVDNRVFTHHLRLNISFDLEEIKAIEVFDPEDWNSYPMITPPPRMLMRVEGYNKVTYASFRAAAYFDDDGKWKNYHGCELDGYVVSRFRAWDEEEEKAIAKEKEREQKEKARRAAKEAKQQRKEERK